MFVLTAVTSLYILALTTTSALEKCGLQEDKILFHV